MYDPELTITITNELVNYDYFTGYSICGVSQVGKDRKNGYKTYDAQGRNIGIVFMSDDKRTKRYGNAEIMFLKEYREEFGRWRIIRLNGQYTDYKRLEGILQQRNEYVCTTQARNRK